MAEAFAVLGIAANIGQFVEFALQLINEGKEVYNSVHGVRAEHREIEIITEDVAILCDEAKKTVAQCQQQLSSSNATAIQRLATECEALAKRLLRMLEELKVPANARRRGLRTLKNTLKGAGQRKEIADLQRRMLEIDRRLRHRISAMLQQTSQSELLSAIQALDRKTEALKINTGATLNDLRGELIDLLGDTSSSATTNGPSVDKITPKLVAFAEKAENLVRQQNFLEGLMFDSMKRRHDMIKEAHKKTLNWIFQRPETRFMEWLESDSNMYWVKGKAGSGKSTLMKYVCDHYRTRDALQTWAGPQMLVTASYFFWAAGLRMQKSQVGLLQSLLYQVLVASPKLILEYFPDRLAKEPWTRKELFEALGKASRGTGCPLSAKYCFFIDGLDEYGGVDDDHDVNPEELIDLLRRLSTSPNIKICVSSRPWNVFLLAFEGLRHQVAMEKLTITDMKIYVDDLLAQSEGFKEISAREPQCAELVPKIVDRAQGVWLWVFLVVRDLLNDIKGREDYSSLLRRLNEFPRELEKYFEDILDRIEKFHVEEAAKIFLVAVEAPRPLPVLAFKFLLEEARDPHFAIVGSISPLGFDEARQYYEKWRILLNSRCRDLLQVTDIGEQRTAIQDAFTNTYRYVPFMYYQVDFLHRTVRDFLRNNNYEYLRRKAGSEFDATASLCDITLALAKSIPASPHQESLQNPLFCTVDEIMYYSHELDIRGQYRGSAILDELDTVMITHARAWGFGKHWTNVREVPSNSKFLEEYGQNTFLGLAIQSNLVHYVTEKLGANPALLASKRGRPLLDYALRPRRRTPAELPYRVQYEASNVDKGMVKALLEHGANPNQQMHIYEGQTVWSLFLRSCCANLGVPSHIKSAWGDVIETLLEAGADPNIEVLNLDDTRILTVDEAIQTIFWTEPDKKVHLQNRLREIAERRKFQTSLFWRMLGWS